MVVQGIGLEYGQSFEKIEPTIHFSTSPASSKQAQRRDLYPVIPVVGKWILPDKLHHALPFGVTRLGRGETNEVLIDDLKASLLPCRSACHTTGC